MNPKVTINNKNITRERSSRGFSFGELKEAKVSVDRVKSIGIILDPRRNTVYENNVTLLKNILNDSIEAKRQRKIEVKKQLEESKESKNEKPKKKAAKKTAPIEVVEEDVKSEIEEVKVEKVEKKKTTKKNVSKKTKVEKAEVKEEKTEKPKKKATTKKTSTKKQEE